MVGTPELDAIAELCERAGARLALTGDPMQLDAPAAPGGLLAWAEREHRCATLTSLWRFRSDPGLWANDPDGGRARWADEGKATLRLRAGGDRAKPDSVEGMPPARRRIRGPPPSPLGRGPGMRGGGVPDDPAMAEDGQDHAPRRRHQRTGARHEPAHHPRTARARPVRRGPVPPRHAVRRPEDRSRGPDRVPRQQPPGTWPRRTPHRERHGVHRHPHRHGRDRMPRRGRKAMDHTPGLGESELRGRVRDHHPQKARA